MVDDDKKQEPFAVKDKRRFAEGESESIAGDENRTSDKDRNGSRVPPSTPDPTERRKEAAAFTEEEHVPLPNIDFSTFILSLSSNALLHLGLMENPFTKKVERNLPMAKQTIDIVSMLKDKAKGNMTTDEENLIENLLSDLRLKYVNEIKKK